MILPINLIISDPALRSGRPLIAGTTLRVQDIAVAHVVHGMSIADLLIQYPALTPAKAHAALAFYYLHQAEIDAAVAGDDAEIASSKTSV